MYLETAASVHLHIIFPVHRHQRNFAQHLQNTVRLGVGVVFNVIFYLVHIYLHQRLLGDNFHSLQFIIGFRRIQRPEVDYFRRRFQSEVFHNRRFTYRRNADCIIACRYIQFLLELTICPGHRHFYSFVRNTFLGNPDGGIRFSLLG